MITWLIGENSFEIREAVKAIEKAFSGVAEKVDATDITLAALPDLLMGVSLFSEQRLVIIRDITANPNLFEKVPDWIPRVSDAIHVVFVDMKPDKRTTSYKVLKAAADVQEFPAWTERDSAKAEQWVATRAKRQKIGITPALIRQLVARVGTDQWQLASALETLSLLDTITTENLNEVVPPHPQENIFQLFETALEGKTSEIGKQLATLSLQEDPYALFALLSSQAMTLAAIGFADTTDVPAKEFGIHPFVASKMGRYTQRLGKAKLGRIIEAFAQTDADLKRSKGEPWLLIERTLLQVAQ
jgi:DNA polymerase III delta subunit